MSAPPITQAAATKAAPRAHLFGVSVAMVTPFDDGGRVDLGRFVSHAGALIDRGVDGLTLYGTTGEGASLGRSDRIAMLDAAKDAGAAPERISVAIAACDLETAEMQARDAFAAGIRRLLLTPPFYFKGIEDDALFRWVAELIARISDGSPDIILYHIRK